MIILHEISKSFGSKTLFENVTMTFSPGKRYGLTGPNGAGKSTLFRIMTKQVEPSAGTVTLPKRTGILHQNIEDFVDNRVIDVVIMGNAPLWAALQEQEGLYEVEMTDEVGIRLGELQDVIAENDGYMAEADAEVLLTGMGIPPELHELNMHQIPTDQQFRVLLCQALFGNPEALLLDEPTNHLDLESINWLEGFLTKYRGTLVVVSHDRHFLNAVTTDIADIDYETIIPYPGNYDAMVTAKSAVRDRAESEAKSKEKKISQLKEFVQRFGAGSRASQVQSRVREIDRLKPQELKKSNIQRPYIRFFASEKQPGKVILKAENISKSYNEEAVFKNLDLEVLRGEKIGIIGNNGRGKTTLVKLLAQQLKSETGEVSLGHDVKVTYFPQAHKDLIEGCGDDTAFEWLRKQKQGIYDQDIRSALGKMLFAGDDAHKPVATLSGGETARLILAGMMLSEHNVMILDEPNNHLDLEAVSALAWGLQDYPGTALVVSHDRDLISTVATKLIAFEEDKIEIFDGNLEEYLEHKKSITS